MAGRSKRNNPTGEKKISGINKFLYRGYEVYDSEGNPVQSNDNNTAPGFSFTELPKDRSSIESPTSAVDIDLTTGRVSSSSDSATSVVDETKAEKPKYRKRQIRDDKVWENLNKINDPVIRGGLSSTVFNGTVNQQLTEIKLSDTKKEITPRTIIAEIISMQQHIKFVDGCSSYLKYIDGTVEKTVSVHKNMITFLKAAIVSQYNASNEFSQIVSAFICELVLCIISGSYQLPISVPTNSKLQEVILKELNEYCKELFANCNIKYNEVVEEQPAKKAKKKAESIIDQLVESADVARV